MGATTMDDRLAYRIYQAMPLTGFVAAETIEYDPDTDTRTDSDLVEIAIRAIDAWVRRETHGTDGILEAALADIRSASDVLTTLSRWDIAYKAMYLARSESEATLAHRLILSGQMDEAMRLVTLPIDISADGDEDDTDE